jgi:thioredoxin-related protein
VDGLETEMGTKLHVLRLNIQDQVGRELAPVYDFEYTPTFIFFDGKGKELWRSIGEIDVQRVRDSMPPQ